MSNGDLPYKLHDSYDFSMSIDWWVNPKDLSNPAVNPVRAGTATWYYLSTEPYKFDADFTVPGNQSQNVWRIGRSFLLEGLQTHKDQRIGEGDITFQTVKKTCHWRALPTDGYEFAFRLCADTYTDCATPRHDSSVAVISPL